MMLTLWSDIWNVSYIELRIWNRVSYEHHSNERNLSNAYRSLKKSGLQRGHGSNPVEVLTFSGFYTHCLNCVHYCDDRISLNVNIILCNWKTYMIGFLAKSPCKVFSIHRYSEFYVLIKYIVQGCVSRQNTMKFQWFCREKGWRVAIKKNCMHAWENVDRLSIYNQSENCFMRTACKELLSYKVNQFLVPQYTHFGTSRVS